MVQFCLVKELKQKINIYSSETIFLFCKQFLNEYSLKFYNLEKSFSKTYVKGDIVHIFYVSKKDLADSQEFLQSKRILYNQIFAKRSKNITANWFSRERLSYYILNNI